MIVICLWKACVVFQHLTYITTTSWIVCDPDPDHPLEGDIAQELVEKPDEYAEKAFKHAQEHATKAKANDAMAKGKQGGKK